MNALQVEYETERLKLEQERQMIEADRRNQESKTDLAKAQLQRELALKTQEAENERDNAAVHLETAKLRAEADTQQASREAELLKDPNYRDIVLAKLITEAIKASNYLTGAQVAIAAGQTFSPFRQMAAALTDAKNMTLFGGSTTENASDEVSQPAAVSSS